MNGWMESMIKKKRNKENRKKIFTDEKEAFRECF